LVFLYREVLGRPIELGSFVRAKRPRRLPVVLTREEVGALLDELTGTRRLMASLLYGTGMRLMEVVRLRVKDVDFGYGQIVVRDAKGAKDRVVPLPKAATEPLRAHLARVSFDPRSRVARRHHLHENGLQKAVKNAGVAAGITKRVNCHSLRHSPTPRCTRLLL
jgi:integrase